MTTHLAPQDGICPCCGRKVYELPDTDWITTNPDDVTCTTDD